MKMLGIGILCAIAAALASTPAYCTAFYSSEILRGGTKVALTSQTDTVVISLTGMTLGNYDCSGNGGFDQSGGPPGTIYHAKALISQTNTVPVTGGHAAGKNSIEVPFNADGTYITMPTGTWRFLNTTTAYLILNAYYDTADGVTSGFGYIQCVGAP